MSEQVSIPKKSTAVVLNDMINGNLQTGRPDHDAAIEASGISREVGTPCSHCEGAWAS